MCHGTAKSHARAARLLLVAVLVALAAPIAASARAGAQAPRAGIDATAQEGGSASRAYFPLVLAAADLAGLAAVPTAAATEPPPEPTATETALPTATATPIVCGPLPERVRVRAVDVSPSTVRASSNRGRNTFPIYLAPTAGGGAKIAWSDTDGGVHLTTVNALDRRVGDDVVMPGDEARGLVAHDDGSTALLTVSGRILSLVKRGPGGEEVFAHQLIGLQPETVTGSKWVDDWGHEARLVWAAGEYAAYSGHTQYFGAAQGKHQGDLLWHFDAQGVRIQERGKGWDWGCSHSLDLRLAHNGTRFGPVCLSDAYPQPGFHFNHREAEIRREPSGDGRGGSDARLGGWVPLQDGFLMSYASPEGSPSGSTDVGVIKVYNDGAIGPPHWLTNTPGLNEEGPHLARYGRDQFLASWTDGGRHLIAVIDELGAIEEGPVAIDAPIAARDDFQTMPDGDVAWAAAWDEMSAVRVVRVDSCGSPPVETPYPPTSVPTATEPAEPTEPPTPGPSPTPTVRPTDGPQQCRNVLTNGSFEDGLEGWTQDGETALGFSDRSGGRFAAKLLGRNDVTAELRQRVNLPPDAASAHLVFWWHMTTAEGAGRAYDLITVTADGTTPLEVLSNVAGRDAWRLSAYEVPVARSREVALTAVTNRRDASTFLFDDVQLIACTGSAATWPSLSVSPASGPPAGPFTGRGTGFEAGEAVWHWALEPGSLVRHDLGSAAAGAGGALETAFGLPAAAAPGAWRWNAAGGASLRPGSTGFTVVPSAAR